MCHQCQINARLDGKPIIANKYPVGLFMLSIVDPNTICKVEDQGHACAVLMQIFENYTLKTSYIIRTE